jgi:uncharacterized membrane protein
MRFADLYLWFLLYSVVGWVYESLLFTVYCRRPVNRGFLTGPFLPLYGSGGVMVVALFYGRIEHPAAIFFLSLVLTTALEYLTAVVMENLFQAKWWDYSKFPLNYKGRISVISSLVFAAMALLTLRYVHPHVERLTSLIPPLHKHLILALATIALLVDLTITIRHVFILNGRLREIQGAINSFLAEKRKQAGSLRQNILSSFEESEFYTERIRTLFRLDRWQNARLFRAFPDLRSARYGEALSKLKNRVLRRKGAPGEDSPESAAAPDDESARGGGRL